MGKEPMTWCAHAQRLSACAAGGAERAGRPGAVAAVNERLWARGSVPRSLYAGPGRALWLAAVNEVLRARGLPEAADHEFHIAPEGGLPPTPGRPGDPTARPDPWMWAVPHAVSKAKCSGTVHQVVFDRGTLSYPDHPADTLHEADCYRSPHLRAVHEAREAAGPLCCFTPGYFTELGLAVVPFRYGWEHGWSARPDLSPDPDDERYEQRYATTVYDDTLRAALIPPLEDLTLHDPLRPDLTTVTVRRTPHLPAGAWWRSPGILSMSVCLSAWWPLEVRDRPWNRVDGLLALDVLAWDLKRSVPHEMLLLDWADDPAAQLHEPTGEYEQWWETIGAPLAPVLVRAEVTSSHGTGWKIFTELERTVLNAEHP
ncbi:MAG: hypothetical protein JO362_19415 [Streptomycetaceae bacterium]|nr:hypothetical protein [Streptomycetaceae bacterium]